VSSAPDPAAAGASAVPVCPRHPDRESYVRCQRCERPVCPQCQRQAPVGVQCVDCAREGSRRVRTGRTLFGGRVTDGPPRVTQVLIGLCVLGFVLQRVPGLGVTDALSFREYYAAEQPWRYLTGAFLHAVGTFGFLHIAMNMYALWLEGPYLEHAFGRARFAALYLVSAFAGHVGYQLLTPAVVRDGGGLFTTGAVGASGAVFGLFGALLLVQRRLRLPPGQVVGVLAVNLVLGFVVPGIAWQAHLGGLVGGAAVAAVLVYAPRERRALVQWGGTALVVAVLVALAVVGLVVDPTA
jgi:membrane associated rhomboid family serine protease